jgi:hypothetical protein
MEVKPLVLKRGWVYEILLRFEATYTEQQRKRGVCLQDDELCSAWNHANFARTHSFKDNKQPLLFPWDVFVPPSDSKTEFGIKIICNEIWNVEKKNIIRELYRLKDDKIKELDRKLVIALGF